MNFRVFFGTSTNDTFNSSKLDLSNFKSSGNLLPKKISPKYIKSIALVAFGKEYKVNLEVSEIKFY